MVMSTVSISIYLIRHIQRMLASGKTCSSPKFLGQLRVTIAGVVQGLLYFVCAVWNTHKFVEENLSQLVDAHVHFTVINVYMLGTTLNLWVGQSVFRQKTVDLFQVFKPGILTKPGATEDPGRLPL
ncbi:taste receptor, type 2, member 201, tandem duplicate 1 [Synchiropus picturatus]